MCCASGGSGPAIELAFKSGQSREDALETSQTAFHPQQRVSSKALQHAMMRARSTPGATDTWN